MEPQTGLNVAQFVGIAGHEARQGLVWVPGGDATKYTKKFEGLFGTNRFPWCAAFVTWCLEQSGVQVPMKLGPKQYPSSLVEAWHTWGTQQKFGFVETPDYKAQAGDLVLFDWQMTSGQPDFYGWDDHIGVLLYMDQGLYVVAEGNVKNQARIEKHAGKFIQNFLRIPEGYTFPSQPFA